MPSEPEQTTFGIYYDPVSVSGGTSVVIKPVGNVTGYSLSVLEPLPTGLLFDATTGRVVGVAAGAGNHDTIVRAGKDGFYADLVLSLTIS